MHVGKFDRLFASLVRRRAEGVNPINIKAGVPITILDVARVVMLSRSGCVPARLLTAQPEKPVSESRAPRGLTDGTPTNGLPAGALVDRSPPSAKADESRPGNELAVLIARCITGLLGRPRNALSSEPVGIVWSVASGHTWTNGNSI
jgi:hypothetical protein